MFTGYVYRRKCVKLHLKCILFCLSFITKFRVFKEVSSKRLNVSGCVQRLDGHSLIATRSNIP